MAIIKTLTELVSFEEVWPVLTSGSDALNEYKESFEAIYNDLKFAVPTENIDHLTVCLEPDCDQLFSFYFEEEEADAEEETDEEPQLLVCAYKPGDDESYGIGIKPAEQIVGLNLSDETLSEYSPAQILACILREITYSTTLASSAYGFTMDMAGGGLYASQVCIENGPGEVSLKDLRQELGHGEAESLKDRYGFLF